MAIVKSRLPGSSRYYGWKPQAPDRRDLRFLPPRRVLESLPPLVDWREKMGPVLDQGPIGSCGPNSVASIIMFDQQKQGMAVDVPSRLAIYWLTRQLMGTINEDSGVDNRTMLRALNQYGQCSEKLWRYIPDEFRTKPTAAALEASALGKVTNYAAVRQDLDIMRGTLASDWVFLFGFTVYESFESQEVARTGRVPLPHPGERSVGGHDIVLVGYDDATQEFLFKNSWNGWGVNGTGYGRMPYAYATDPNLASDFWVINAIPGGTPTPGPTPTPTPVPVVKSLFTMNFDRPVPKGGRVTFIAPVAIPAGTYEVAARGQQVAEDGDGADREFHADARE